MARFQLLACFLLVAACGDADGQPPAESDVRTTIMANTAADPSVVCHAGQTRECKIFWTSASESGVQHCFIGTQVCRDDGYGWNACGDSANEDAGAKAE